MRHQRIGIAAVVISTCVWGSALRADGPTPERATFQTFDAEKVAIVGDFYPAPPQEGVEALPPVVILLHMYKVNRSTWAPLIPELNRAGISALAIDLRGHGESIEPADLDLVDRVKQRDTGLFKDMKHDVFAAYVWLAEQGKVDLSRLGIVGASIGSTAAFAYAADDTSVDVVVALSPGTSYMRIKTVPIVKKIVGKAILCVSPQDEQTNANTLKKANETITIKVVKPDEQALTEDEEIRIHGTMMFGKVKGIERFIAQYLVSRLGDPASEPVAITFKSKVYYPIDHEKVVRFPLKSKRLFSNPLEAESRGLRKVGTKGKKGASGAIDL